MIKLLFLFLLAGMCASGQTKKDSTHSQAVIFTPIPEQPMPKIWSVQEREIQELRKEVEYMQKDIEKMDRDQSKWDMITVDSVLHLRHQMDSLIKALRERKYLHYDMDSLRVHDVFVPSTHGENGAGMIPMSPDGVLLFTPGEIKVTVDTSKWMRRPGSTRQYDMKIPADRKAYRKRKREILQAEHEKENQLLGL